MDGINVLFVAAAWLVLFARRETMEFPLALPCWTIMAASTIAAFAAIWLDRVASVLLVDVYLYLWFVTLAHYLSRRCSIAGVGMVWSVVSCMVAALTLGDAYFGMMGGQFSGMRRATGTFENPNMFGNYLVVSFFLTWAVAETGRPLFYLALPFLFLGIRATASNGALLAMLGGAGAVVLSLRGFWNRRVLGLVCIVLGITIAVVGVYREDIETFAMRELGGARGEVGGAALKGAGERFPIWETVFETVLESPIGVGPGNFASVNAALTGDYHGAHNEYLGMLGERGFLGLAGWLALLVSVFGMLRALDAAAPAGYRPLGMHGLYGLFGAILAHSLVIEVSHFRHFWMVLAMIAAGAWQAVRVSPSTDATTAAPATPPASTDPLRSA
jgi:O-antigen ligase